VSKRTPINQEDRQAPRDQERGALSLACVFGLDSNVGFSFVQPCAYGMIRLNPSGTTAFM
jgi:hypothetical protein